jgi:hypothetical protein
MADLSNVKKGYRLLVDSELSDKPIACHVIGADNGQLATIMPVLFFVHPNPKIAAAMRTLGANVLNPSDVRSVIPPVKKQKAMGTLANLVAAAEESIRLQRRRGKVEPEPIEPEDTEDTEDTEDNEPIEAAPVRRRKIG